MMKRSVLYLTIVLAFFTTNIWAQKVNLVGTTWILKYTTSRANSKDYSEYARITFKKGGKAVFDNGETATWTLKGNKLNVGNENNATVLVHYIDATIKGSTGFGNAEMGMHGPPYWIRLVKQR